MITRIHLLRPCRCPNKGRPRNLREWCWCCYANIRGRGAYKGHLGYVAKRVIERPFEDYVMKRPEGKAAGGTTAGGICSDDTFAKKYPSIVEHLTADKYDDGGARELSTLAISVRDGRMAIALNDKDLKQSAYTMADTLQEALKLMEGALASGAIEWRAWKSGKRR